MRYLTLNFFSLLDQSFHALQTNFFDIFSKVVIGKKISEDSLVANITFVAVQEILTKAREIRLLLIVLFLH